MDCKSLPCLCHLLFPDVNTVFSYGDSLALRIPQVLFFPPLLFLLIEMLIVKSLIKSALANPRLWTSSQHQQVYLFLHRFPARASRSSPGKMPSAACRKKAFAETMQGALQGLCKQQQMQSVFQKGEMEGSSNVGQADVFVPSRHWGIGSVYLQERYLCRVSTDKYKAD